MPVPLIELEARVSLVPSPGGVKPVVKFDSSNRGVKPASDKSKGTSPSSEALNELRGRAARRQAWETEQRAEGRAVPGVTGGTAEPARAERAAIGAEAPMKQRPAAEPRARRAEQTTAPARTEYADVTGRPDYSASGKQRAAENAAREAHERRRDEAVRRGLEGNERIFERGEVPRARREGRADEGNAPPDGQGQAARAVPPGAAFQPGPVSGQNIPTRTRAQARAAVAKAQQLAEGGRDTTPEDLERMNREANIEARRQHEAQQTAARESGRISSGAMTPGYGRHVSPHGRGHEYYA